MRRTRGGEEANAGGLPGLLAEYLRPGGPRGPSASFVERFTPSADGLRLHYTIVMTDAYSLTQPVEQKRQWIAIDEQVMPYNCTWAGDSAQADRELLTPWRSSQ